MTTKRPKRATGNRTINQASSGRGGGSPRACCDLLRETGFRLIDPMGPALGALAGCQRGASKGESGKIAAGPIKAADR